MAPAAPTAGEPTCSATKTAAVVDAIKVLAAAANAALSAVLVLAGWFQVIEAAAPRAARMADQVSLATTPTAVPRL